MSSPVQVMIVDDSALVRKVMTDLLNEDPMIEVIAQAQDPIFAQKKLEQLTPDVIVLDIEMPRMDGLTFLQQLMSTSPIPVVICSSLGKGQAAESIKALRLGAAEVITKPQMGVKGFLEESAIQIREAVKAAAQAKLRGVAKKAPLRQVEPKYTADVIIPSHSSGIVSVTDKIIAIGASTGGTQALRDVLAVMPENSPATLIVQHMPENFTKAFADHLNEISPMTVREAEGGEILKRGECFVAPGNRHMLIKRNGGQYVIELVDGPLVNRHRPAVDVMFRSVARAAGKNAVGCLLTGMGADGAAGLKELLDAGAATFAQDEATSIVYGMPKEAWKLGAAQSQVALNDVAVTLLEACKK